MLRNLLPNQKVSDFFSRHKVKSLKDFLRPTFQIYWKFYRKFYRKLYRKFCWKFYTEENTTKNENGEIFGKISGKIFGKISGKIFGKISGKIFSKISSKFGNWASKSPLRILPCVWKKIRDFLVWKQISQQLLGVWSSYLHHLNTYIKGIQNDVQHCHQKVSLKITPPLSAKLCKKKGGVIFKSSIQNFFLRIFLVKKFSGAKRRKNKGVIFSDTFW